MRTIRQVEYENCSVIAASYKGAVHMPPHIDAQSKITIVLEGSLTEKAGDHFILAKRNSVVIKPNDLVHENVFDSKGVSLLSIAFKERSEPLGIRNWAWVEDARISFQVYKLVYVLKSLSKENEVRKATDDFFQTVEIIKKYESSRKPAWLEKFLFKLKQHPLHQETVEAMAERLKITRVHLSRNLKKHLAISPVRYRHFSRLSEMMHLFAISDQSLDDIAYECGFCDPCQMSRVVKKETGFTPQALRLLLRK